MAGTQEKIQLLLKIAHRLNEAGVEWALGASMMLYFKDITSDKKSACPRQNIVAANRYD